jgi:hypothetical protein
MLLPRLQEDCVRLIARTPCKYDVRIDTVRARHIRHCRTNRYRLSRCRMNYFEAAIGDRKPNLSGAAAYVVETNPVLRCRPVCPIVGNLLFGRQKANSNELGSETASILTRMSCSRCNCVNSRSSRTLPRCRGK